MFSLTYRPYDVRVAGWLLGHCFEVGGEVFGYRVWQTWGGQWLGRYRAGAGGVAKTGDTAGTRGRHR